MIEVALCPSEIARFSATDLSGATVVVFDVLRATSSMITGLGAGALEIFPVNSIEEARERKLKEPELLLAGERDGLPPEGFDRPVRANFHHGYYWMLATRRSCAARTL